MIGHTYVVPRRSRWGPLTGAGEPCTVILRGTFAKGSPRNVLTVDAEGRHVVRPFYGLRLPK